MDGSTNRVVIKIVIVTAAIWAVLSLTSSSPETSQMEEDAIRVDTQIVNYALYPKMITAYGKVAAKDPLHVDTEVSAKITQLYVENGSEVVVGQIIATLDSTDFETEKERLEQSIEKIKSQISASITEVQATKKLIEHDKKLLENAKDMLERYLSLSEQYRSEQGLDQREDNVSQRTKSLTQNQTNLEKLKQKALQLSADLDTAKSRLKDNAVDIANCQIMAKQAGVITDLTFEVGDYLNIGSDLCTLINPDHTYIHAYIPTKYYGVLDKGQKALLKTSDSTLVLSHIDQVVDPQSVHLDALFDYQGESENLPIGQVVTLAIEIPQTTPSFKIDESAIYDEAFIYQVQAGQLIKHPVAFLGLFYEGSKTQYLIQSDQLFDGDMVLTSRLSKPKSGLKVTYEENF